MKPKSESTIGSTKGAARFTFGTGYTRREIHEVLGGSLEQYLPSVNGRVVAVCLDPDPALQPFPPAQVFVGPGPTIRQRAAALVSQDEPVPVFIKRAPNDWEFRGYWRPTRLDDDPESVRRIQARAGVRREVVAVVWLEPYSVGVMS